MPMNKYLLRKQFRGVRILVVLFIISVVSLVMLFLPELFITDHDRHLHLSDGASENVRLAVPRRKLLEVSNNESMQTNEGMYPHDLFTLDERRKGAVILHILGMIYMFIALAIICDEFFVPALGVITNKLNISEDVAGATFMAAGGSAPELFTSFIGVFLAKSNVGIGTIVGSAVFNILFVIGMCAIVSKTVLSLTWWPLFRDMSFYSLGLSLLIAFFIDKRIDWYEAGGLLCCYIAYVIFMKFNAKIEYWVKSKTRRKWSSRVKNSDDSLLEMRRQRTQSLPILHSGSGKFRHGVLQLMIHTIDPLCEERVHDQAIQLHAVATLKVSLDELRSGGKDTPNNNHPAAQPDRNNMYSEPIGNPGKLTSVNAISNGKLQLNGHIISSPDCDIEDTSVTSIHSIIEQDSGERLTRGRTNHGLHLENDELAYSPRPPPSYASISQVPSVIIGHSSTADVLYVNSHSNNTENSENAQSAIRWLNHEQQQQRAILPSEVSHPVVQQLRTDRSETTDTTSTTDTQWSPRHETLEDENSPLDLSWPKTWRKRIIYIAIAPIIFPLWLTLPDVRRDDKRQFFIVTFLGSIMWIGLFSYLMVWWANQTGETIPIPDEVMGLTILAAGTSIPDLITSVIVAKKGFGDMAVSSSVGSNIFDITVGLPLPWLFYSIINSGAGISVDSNGLFCSIVLLFIMLLSVLLSIALCKWKMSKGLGASMFVLYVIFVTLSLLMEYNIIPCPISV